MKVTKQFKMEVAHRLVSSYSKKCQSIHGHSYLMEVTLESEHLNDDAMVMDFGEVKDKMNSFFESFDHSLVVYDKDIMLPLVMQIESLLHIRLMVVDYNPTAEGMAHHVFREMINQKLPIVEVRVQETLTGWAVADRPKPFYGESVKYYNIPERFRNAL